MPASPEAVEHAVKRAAKIFGIIKQAAERGESCPTNRNLGERFGCGDTPIVNALVFLEANGMIEVERGNDRRVVTIRATGERTAGRVGKPHWSRAPDSTRELKARGV